jgi:hypothetical protein
LVVVLVCLVLASVNAQNLLKNGSFENPIDPQGSSGTTNWTVVYAYGGPADFAYADRTTEACKPDDPTYPGGSWGAAFRANHAEYMHAYHKQVVTNLTPGASYTLSGYMHRFSDLAQVRIYIETYGGADGTTLATITNATTTRTKYFLTNSASASGQLEIRLGFQIKPEIADWNSEDPKFPRSAGYFDVFSLTPTP